MWEMFLVDRVIRSNKKAIGVQNFTVVTTGRATINLLLIKLNCSIFRISEQEHSAGK